ncbi:M24 family metallopeptidase [Natrialbaceae archaeon GCM10025810]|uniref:M24 family metallopeptidase n=1 Tax=Halovalidus salilacus TaxID=3075124 RepID=UPI0036090C87
MSDRESIDGGPPIPGDPFEDRAAACRRRLEAVGADVAVCGPSPNFAYATGFEEEPSERHLLLFLPRAGDSVVVAPAMYEGELAVRWVEDVRHWDDGDDVVSLLESVLSEVLDRDAESEGGGPRDDGGPGDDRILVDDRLWARFTHDLRSVRPDAVYGLASEVFEPLRIRKDERELEALERAARLADRVSLELRSRGDELVGTTESELAAEIDRLLAEGGGTEPAFPTIVAAGPNGARPHHRAGDREIEPGDPVVLDFGAFVPATYQTGTGHYPGDQTRTVVFGGDPPPAYETAHEVVREAQEAAIDAIEPGVAVGEIDRVARSVIEEAGYGDAFVHRTGHGVGLEVHEAPYVVEGNDRDLEPGMVFSVEPGIYLEGRFGVRIEDLVVVTDDGARRLNETPRGWRPLSDE